MLYNKLYQNTAHYKTNKKEVKMIVTTLPISYRQGRSFRILFTPLVSSFIAKICMVDSIYPIDLMGMRNPMLPPDREKTVASYKRELAELCICHSNKIFVNTEESFWSYVLGIIDQQISNGQCRFVNTEVTFCDCGKIELPTNVFKLIKKQERLKLSEY